MPTNEKNNQNPQGGQKPKSANKVYRLRFDNNEFTTYDQNSQQKLNSNLGVPSAVQDTTLQSNQQPRQQPTGGNPTGSDEIQQLNNKSGSTNSSMMFQDYKSQQQTLKQNQKFNNKQAYFAAQDSQLMQYQNEIETLKKANSDLRGDLAALKACFEKISTSENAKDRDPDALLKQSKAETNSGRRDALKYASDMLRVIIDSNKKEIINLKKQIGDAPQVKEQLKQLQLTNQRLSLKYQKLSQAKEAAEESYKKLQQDVAKDNKDRENINTQLQALKQTNTQLQEQIKQYEQTKQKTATLQQQLMQAQQNSTAAMSQYKELLSQYTPLKEHAENVESQNTRLQEQLKTATASNVQLKFDKQKLQKDLTAAQNQNNQLNLAKQNLQQQVDAKDQTIQQLTADKQNKDTQINGLQQQLVDQAALQTQIQQLQNGLTAAQNQNNQLNLAKQNLQQQVDAKDQTIQQLTTSKQNLQQQVDAKDQTIQQLTADKQNKDTQINGLQQQLVDQAALQTQIQQLTKDNNQLTADKQNLQQQVDEKEAMLDELENQHQTYLKDLSARHKTALDAKDKTIQQLNLANQNKDTQINGLQQQLVDQAALQTQIQQLQNQLKVATDKLTDLTQAQQTKSNADNEVIEGLKQQIDQLNGLVTSLQGEKERLSADKLKLEQEKRDYNQLRDLSEKQADTIKTLINTNKIQENIIKNYTDAQKDSDKGYEEQLNKLGKEIKSLNTQIQALQDKNAALEAEKLNNRKPDTEETYKKLLQSKEQTIASLKKQYEDAKQRADQLQAQIDKQKNDNIITKDKQDSQDRSIESYKKQNTDLAAQNKDLKEENELLKQELEKLKNEQKKQLNTNDSKNSDTVTQDHTPDKLDDNKSKSDEQQKSGGSSMLNDERGLQRSSNIHTPAGNKKQYFVNANVLAFKHPSVFIYMNSLAAAGDNAEARKKAEDNFRASAEKNKHLPVDADVIIDAFNNVSEPLDNSALRNIPLQCNDKASGQDLIYEAGSNPAVSGMYSTLVENTPSIAFVQKQFGMYLDNPKNAALVAKLSKDPNFLAIKKILKEYSDRPGGEVTEESLMHNGRQFALLTSCFAELCKNNGDLAAAKDQNFAQFITGTSNYFNNFVEMALACNEISAIIKKDAITKENTIDKSRQEFGIALDKYKAAADMLGAPEIQIHDASFSKTISLGNQNSSETINTAQHIAQPEVVKPQLEQQNSEPVKTEVSKKAKVTQVKKSQSEQQHTPPVQQNTEQPKQSDKPPVNNDKPPVQQNPDESTSVEQIQDQFNNLTQLKQQMQDKILEQQIQEESIKAQQELAQAQAEQEQLMQQQQQYIDKINAMVASAVGADMQSEQTQDLKNTEQKTEQQDSQKQEQIQQQTAVDNNEPPASQQQPEPSASESSDVSVIDSTTQFDENDKQQSTVENNQSPFSLPELNKKSSNISADTKDQDEQTPEQMTSKQLETELSLKDDKQSDKSHKKTVKKYRKHTAQQSEHKNGSQQQSASETSDLYDQFEKSYNNDEKQQNNTSSKTDSSSKKLKKKMQQQQNKNYRYIDADSETGPSKQTGPSK